MFRIKYGVHDLYKHQEKENQAESKCRNVKILSAEIQWLNNS